MNQTLWDSGPAAGVLQGLQGGGTHSSSLPSHSYLTGEIPAAIVPLTVGHGDT